MIECPYCFTRVELDRDGICPACRRDVSDRSNVDPDKTTLTIWGKAKQPWLCCTCVVNTNRQVKVVRSRKWQTVGSPEESNTLVTILALLFGGCIGLVFALSRGLGRSSGGER